MMLPRIEKNQSGLTWVEVVVALSILSILATFAYQVLTIPTCGRGGMTFTLSNMKQLHLATQAAVLDGTTIGDTNLGWPGDTGGTFTNWMHQLVPAYLSTNDFCKLLSAPGKIVRPGELPAAMSESAVLVYAVRASSPTNAVFLTTANYTNGPAGGQRLLAAAKPYGMKGFVVFRKGGEGDIFMAAKVADTNAIGSYVPLLK